MILKNNKIKIARKYFAILLNPVSQVAPVSLNTVK